jgi:peptidoglycan hydrolase-like protein with peptidoglycan-binding domain
MAAGLLAACSNSNSDHAALGSSSGAPESVGTPSQANAGAPMTQQQPTDSASNSAGGQQQPVALAGDDVRNAQTKLQAQGYYHGRIDGISGPQTRRAIIAYQRHNGLPQTGTLDADTMANLTGGATANYGATGTVAPAGGR